jgi:SAM-dependent methyltransferase
MRSRSGRTSFLMRCIRQWQCRSPACSFAVPPDGICPDQSLNYSRNVSAIIARFLQRASATLSCRAFGRTALLSVQEQIERGLLVCPSTLQPLIIQGESLHTADGRNCYPFTNGIPLLFKDSRQQRGYLESDGGRMTREYRAVSPGHLRSALRALARHDHRSPQSRTAFLKALSGLSADALCISIGGGPTRPHPSLVNLNIGPFPNVDVVADAYHLPYGGESVDAVFCEAVLEHLEYPDRAVSEMWRVLRHGSRLFAATPFLQPYHGYPDHYQNFTLNGHRRLFERAGFSITSSGTCVGPTVALSQMISLYAKSYLPTRALKLLAGFLADSASILLKPLDRVINRNPESNLLASTTYVFAVKQ